MKFFVFFSILLSLLVAFTYSEECGEGGEWKTEGFARQFTCSSDGVTLTNKVPGCACTNFDEFYNENEKKCMPLSCDNLDCVGKANEAFYRFESSSRDVCACTNFIRRDARTGCMCKNGFCRKEPEAPCTKRDCDHPVYH